MDTVTISSKYQIVIPRAIREKWKAKPGQKVRLIIYGNRLEVVPVRDIQGSARLSARHEQRHRA